MQLAGNSKEAAVFFPSLKCICLTACNAGLWTLCGEGKPPHPSTHPPKTQILEPTFYKRLFTHPTQANDFNYTATIWTTPHHKKTAAGLLLPTAVTIH